MASKSISRSRESLKRGGGIASTAISAITKPVGAIVNKAIDLLPIELHLPGYHYCGPGTKLKKRLSRGDPGINRLDQACKQHDIAYSRYSDTGNRSIADRVLAEKAWQRVKSSDASVGEKAAAFAVAAAMKGKTTFGGGKRRKRRRSGRRASKKSGGNIRRKRRSNVKKSKKKTTVWSMIKKGGGLYLRPYRAY